MSNLIEIKQKSYDLPNIMLSNINGALCDKIPEIHEVAKSNDIDIICLTETWCRSNIPDDCIQIPGYNCYRRDRQDGRACGGIACYVKDSFPVTHTWNELNETELETLFITTRPHKLPRKISHVNIGLVYHPPKSDDWAMVNHLINSIDSIKGKFIMSDFMIFGDFNHLKDKYFKSSTQLKQIVKTPTHESSIIDLCYTSINEYYNEPEHIP